MINSSQHDELNCEKGNELVKSLTSQGYWHSRGKENKDKWIFFDETVWLKFTSFWDDLLLDKYMGDGGRYRYRRYSQFNYNNDTRAVNLLKHEAYQQSQMANYLNGGFKRYYEPIEEQFLSNHFFISFIEWLGNAYSKVTGHSQWNVKLHPYRIRADIEKGQPSPEGIHRDGVDFVCTFMIRKCNAVGGETVITDNQKNPITRLTMENPCDIVVGNDNATMHGVSSVSAINPDKPCAYRDVLVVAFAKI